MSLEQSIQFHRECLARNLDAARHWKSQNKHGQELCWLYNALQESLCLAVSSCETPQTGIEYLKNEFKPKVFNRTLELIRRLHLSGSAPPEHIGSPSIFQLVLTVHVAWLLDLYAEAGEIASIYDDEKQIRFYQRGGLWSDYARGITAVADRRQFTPVQRKYKGYDSHWATYLQLMSAICAGRDLSPAIALVDESFSRRNKDKRLLGDGLDGDGAFPVKWDFRKHSLLLAAEHNAAAGF